MRRQAAHHGRHRHRLDSAGPSGRWWRKGAFTAFLAGALLALLLLAVVFPGWWSTPATTHNAPAAVEAVPQPATSPPDPQSSKSPSAVPSESAPQRQVPDEVVASDNGAPPLHIRYAAVGMDQAVVPLTPTAQELELNSIVPPHTPDAYWLSPYGMPGAGSTNTTYVVGHSWEGGASPFNNISARAKAGDLLTLTTAEGQMDFRVDGVTTEYKETLRDSKIWDIVPGRLIVITCYAADLWGKNIIVQASPMPVP